MSTQQNKPAQGQKLDNSIVFESDAKVVKEVDVNAVLSEAAQTGNLSDAKFNALLTLMMAKEARLMEKEKLIEQRIAMSDEERRKESERYALAIIENQSKCKHLKGGSFRRRSQAIDPAVYGHTFADGKTRIICNLCKAKWYPGDTAEFFLRNGKKVPNWTGIGWREAVAMAENSSNRPSSSERPPVGAANEYAVSEETRKIAQTDNLQF